MNTNDERHRGAFIRKLYGLLKDFDKQARTPGEVGFENSRWILSRDERIAVKVVLEILKDCHVHIPKKKKEHTRVIRAL